MTGNPEMQIKLFACVGVGGCLTSFVATAIPYLQFTVLVITLAASLRALLVKRKKS
jgi:hypothetical protein